MPSIKETSAAINAVMRGDPSATPGSDTFSPWSHCSESQVAQNQKSSQPASSCSPQRLPCWVSCCSPKHVPRGHSVHLTCMVCAVGSLCALSAVEAPQRLGVLSLCLPGVLQVPEAAPVTSSVRGLVEGSWAELREASPGRSSGRYLQGLPGPDSGQGRLWLLRWPVRVLGGALSACGLAHLHALVAWRQRGGAAHHFKVRV